MFPVRRSESRINVPHDNAELDKVADIVAKAAPEADRGDQFPWTGIRAVHAGGFLNGTVGAAFGGRGETLVDTAHVLAALGRGDPSVALITAMTLYTHLGEASRNRWPRALYRRILEETKTRPVLLNAARVEPELGSPARGGLPSTLARRTGNGWSISGRKRFVTGALGLTYFLVWATTDETPQRVGTFVVPADSRGINIIQNWNSLGMRASGSHDVEFDAVEIPHEDVIDLTDISSGTQDNLAHAGMTLALTAIYLGVAEAARDNFIRFAHERVPANLGYPVARTERFINLAGEIDLLVSGARQIIFDGLNHGLADGEKMIRARLLAGRQLKEAVQIAVGALGNPGLGADLGLERNFRDIQSVLVHAPQEDTSVAMLGRAALQRGAPAPTPATLNPRPETVSSNPIRKAG